MHTSTAHIFNFVKLEFIWNSQNYLKPYSDMTIFYQLSLPAKE